MVLGLTLDSNHLLSELGQFSYPFSTLPCVCVCVCALSLVWLSATPWTVYSPPRLLCPWNSPDKNTGVVCHFLLQGNFPIQGLNPCHLCLLYWEVASLPFPPLPPLPPTVYCTQLKTVNYPGGWAHWWCRTFLWCSSSVDHAHMGRKRQN